MNNVARGAIYAQQTGEVFVPLLTISHSSIDTIRIVGDNQGITVDGNWYDPFPFEYELPSNESGMVESLIVKVVNVSREIVSLIRSVNTKPSATFRLIMRSDPTVNLGKDYEMDIRAASWDALMIELTLSRSKNLSVNFPRTDFKFTPVNYPGLF
jgi:hypothetical protein